MPGFCLGMNDHEKHKDDESNPNHHPPSRTFRVDQLLLSTLIFLGPWVVVNFMKVKALLGAGLKVYGFTNRILVTVKLSNSLRCYIDRIMSK